MTAVVYALLFVLVVGNYHELTWAWSEMRGYRRGEISTTVEWEQFESGRELLGRGAPNAALWYLERSVEIDPTTEAVFYLGEARLRVGRVDAALEAYESYRRLNPRHGRVCERIAAIQRERGDVAAARSVLSACVARLRRAVELYQPRHDTSVHGRYNKKAAKVHRTLIRDLETAERALGLLPD